MPTDERHRALAAYGRESGDMDQAVYTPQPPLSNFVTCFWIRQGPSKPAKELALPTGTVEMVINFREERLWVFGRNKADSDDGFKGGIMCGPHSEYFVIDSAANEEVIGVNFKPGGIFPFLDIPSDELQNTLAPLDALWNSRAVELRDQLLNARTNQERFSRLERFLLRQAFRPLALDPRVTYSLSVIQRGSTPQTVAALADDVGSSKRRFIELFRTITGLTPKQYIRVQRLQEVLWSIDGGELRSWADIAFSCGYYDQSHFYRDFHAMTSMLPGEYAKRRGERHNHVPILDC